MKIREGLGRAGLPVLGAAGALAVCCTIHLILLAGGFGVLAAAALRWWPAAAAIAVVGVAAVVGVRTVRWRGRGVADCCATGAARARGRRDGGGGRSPGCVPSSTRRGLGDDRRAVTMAFPRA